VPQRRGQHTGSPAAILSYEIAKPTPFLKDGRRHCGLTFANHKVVYACAVPQSEDNLIVALAEKKRAWPALVPEEKRFCFLE